MAKIIVCPGYGVGSAEVQIMVDRITHWHSIDYNGNHGTEIYLDTGKSVRVSACRTMWRRPSSTTRRSVA